MITFQKVSFRYAGEESKGAVFHIDLHVRKGEVVLLTGESGCGKSTLLRLINGLAPHFYEGEVEGKVLVDRLEPKDTPLFRLAPVVGSVFQNPRTQFYNVDTTGELAFACENMGLPAEEILERMDATVERFRIQDLMDRNIFRLSGGQKQQIACASVDVAGPEIFLLDEPTANLDYEATLKLKEMISIWKEAGKTILIAEHRIAWVWELCDRLIVMKEGEIVSDLDREKMQSLTAEDLVQKQLRSKDEVNPLNLVRRSMYDRSICIRNLQYAYDRKNFSLNISQLTIPENRITALVGENGAGKTTLLHCLSGIIRKAKADVKENGEPVNLKQVWKRSFLVMQDVNHQLFTESVLDEVLISMKEANEEEALRILEQVHMKAYANRHPMSLSGGQKQRVAIACAFASGKDILLFDEPTSGLDRHHMELTAKLLVRLKEMGKTVVLVTHDSELIQLCCDEIISLKEACHE